jgi:hypothetical protein
LSKPERKWGLERKRRSCQVIANPDVCQLMETCTGEGISKRKKSAMSEDQEGGRRRDH